MDTRSVACRTEVTTAAWQEGFTEVAVAVLYVRATAYPASSQTLHSSSDARYEACAVQQQYKAHHLLQQSGVEPVHLAPNLACLQQAL